MSNDLSTMNTRLATSLRDTGYATWSSDELDDLLVWATASLYPRLARRIQEDEEMVDDEHEYGFEVMEVDRVDIIDPATNRIKLTLGNGSWEWFADPLADGGNLYINPNYVEEDMLLRVHGWGRYDLSENMPPDDFVPLILAIARAEAARRETTRRVNSTNWMTTNQVQNVSVNELTQMVNEADGDAERLYQRFQTIRRPKPARRG